MRSLKQRLQQFDRREPRVRGESVRRVVARECALRSLLDSGARSVGAGREAFLRLEEVVDLPPRAAVSLDFWENAGLPRPPSRRAWGILDTETTGLESGTGTLVFLVGLLVWTDRRARLIQFFLPEPAAEVGFWRAVSEAVVACGHLLSYNGAAFDLPRMRTRMRLNRLDPNGLDLPHADLLPPARRLARRWLASARLQTVESGLLGRQREGDLPGSEAPEVYRALLTAGEDRGLADVFRHNRDDVLHLADLTVRLSEIYAGEAWRELPAAARCDLARALAGRGRVDRALEILGTVARTGDGEERAEGHDLAADLFRRRGRFAESRDQLLAALECRPSALDTRLRLAKLYEHRLRDLSAARRCTRDALAVISRRRSLGAPEADSMHAQLVHRLRRIERKITTRGSDGGG